MITIPKSITASVVLFLLALGIDLDKYVMVTVVNDPGRNWIITAFPSDRTPRGELLWQRS